MKTIVVTPAGRKRYVELLLKNLIREKCDFDLWQIWLNTNIKSDIDFLISLSKEYEWIKIIETRNKASVYNIKNFYNYASDENSVYVRLDDDVVWIENGFFKKFVNHRIENKSPLIIYANIINNAITSHIHQRNGLINHPTPIIYRCMDDTGWRCPFFAEKLHKCFIKDLQCNQVEKWRNSFNKWILNKYERMSINAVSWFGEDMAKIKNQIGINEEQCLSVDIPMMLGRPNEVFGDSIVAHFAFNPQREHMDTTDILSLYSKLI